jgi:site-specific DNA recombinase
MRAAIYLRQSKTSDGTISPELQEANCRKLAEREGWTVIEPVYKDIGISGSGEALVKRIGLADLRRAYAEGKFDIAIADDLDRFSRNVADNSIIRGEMKTATAKEGTQDNALYADIQSAFGADYLRRISARWNDALMLRFSKGLPPSGKVHYGYDKVNGFYVQNPRQAAILREAYERYTAGEGARLICDDFNRRALPSAGSAGWYPNGLFDLLDKPFYGGQIAWKPSKDAEALTTRGAHEPILDPAQWAAYRKAREERKTHAKPRNPKWFASGIVRCGLCEAPMVSARDRRGVDNLACSTYNNQGKTGCVGVRRKRSIVSFRIHMWLNSHYEEWAAGMPTDDEAKLHAEKAIADAEEAVKVAQKDYSRYSTFAFEHEIMPSESKPQLDLKKAVLTERKAQHEDALAKLGSFHHSESTSQRVDKGLLLMGFTEGADDVATPEATARFREALSGVIEKVLVMPQSTKAARDPKRNFYEEVVIVPRAS